MFWLLTWGKAKPDRIKVAASVAGIKAEYRQALTQLKVATDALIRARGHIRNIEGILEEASKNDTHPT
jgi:hypothetical protein